MTAVIEATNNFVTSFEREPGHTQAWVNALRGRGMEAFRAQGFPTAKLEEWRTTNVGALAKGNFVKAKLVMGDRAVELAQQFGFGEEAAAELVFVNGIYSPHFSTVSGVADHGAVRVMSLEQAMEKEGELVEKHLGKYAHIEAHPFAALNTSFLREGAFVHIGRGAVSEKPIHLLFLTVGGNAAEAAVSYPRVLVVAEEHSASSIVETYAGGAAPAEAGTVYLTNAVTEIVQEAGARIDHNKVQQEGMAAYHIALMQVMLGRGSSFISHSTSLGSKLTRNDLQVFFGGEGAEATLNGLVYARGEQHIDNHTLLQHEKGHCPSHELYKHVLADKATGVFKGKIFVQKDAQKTDSKQTSKSLLLSDTAFMNSQPALEIYADDVKCTHGSTIGPVDEHAMFYLVSRGLSPAQARHLMTYAFAADITRRIKVGAVRARIEDFMTAQAGLPQDLRIMEEAKHDVALL